MIRRDRARKMPRPMTEEELKEREERIRKYNEACDAERQRASRARYLEKHHTLHYTHLQNGTLNDLYNITILN